MRVKEMQAVTAIVGSGAAGYNAANRLWQLGCKDIVLVTEDRLAGTSRNTGSDKQTYYKLTLSGGDGDSVLEMAKTLFAGECVDGDLALCEAALSARCFLQLVELGVAFPRNRYGEYIGYKTDHDPRRRATSVGPYTSRAMTEKLEAAAIERGIPVLDHLQVIKIISDGEKCYGLLCLDTGKEKNQDHQDSQNDQDGTSLEEESFIEEKLVLVRCSNVIWATGGPAGMYADSVYPLGHYGATGLALEAGALGKNLTEWQYGLASLQPRWNVSGTCMQVLPRLFSTEADGSDEREFLMDFFEDRHEMLSKLFLKGYQWPFDVRKVDGGSSIIDILVYQESCRGRKVYLDYRQNPVGGAFAFDQLSPEAYDYLAKACACFGTPIERLRHMNQPVVDFYQEKGVDLAREPLEIALCAQHNNGGIAIDCWWQTQVEGLFVCGEAAASHGVYRPGGSALNAGQVGSTRAAEYIAARRSQPLSVAGSEEKEMWKQLSGQAAEEEDIWKQLSGQAVEEMQQLALRALENGRLKFQAEQTAEIISVRELWEQATVSMSRCGAAFRDPEKIRPALDSVKYRLDHYEDIAAVSLESVSQYDFSKKHDMNDLSMLFRLRDMLISQQVYLSAMLNYLEQGGKSRGSALYTDKTGRKPYQQLPDTFTYQLDGGQNGRIIQEAEYKDGSVTFSWRGVRPIPEEDDFFENVWRAYRETGNID